MALAVAERLGFDFLDTGAMYRAVGLEALRRQVNLENHRELEFVARHAKIEFDWTKHPPGVLLNHEPVGHHLRGAEATRAASYVAVVPAIREMLVQQQRAIGREIVQMEEVVAKILFPMQIDVEREEIRKVDFEIFRRRKVCIADETIGIRILGGIKQAREKRADLRGTVPAHDFG